MKLSPKLQRAVEYEPSSVVVFEMVMLEVSAQTLNFKKPQQRPTTKKEWNDWLKTLGIKEEEQNLIQVFDWNDEFEKPQPRSCFERAYMTAIFMLFIVDKNKDLRKLCEEKMHHIYNAIGLSPTSRFAVNRTLDIKLRNRVSTVAAVETSLVEVIAGQDPSLRLNQLNIVIKNDNIEEIAARKLSASRYNADRYDFITRTAGENIARAGVEMEKEMRLISENEWNLDVGTSEGYIHDIVYELRTMAGRVLNFGTDNVAHFAWAKSTPEQRQEVGEAVGPQLLSLFAAIYQANLLRGTLTFKLSKNGKHKLTYDTNNGNFQSTPIKSARVRKGKTDGDGEGGEEGVENRTEA